MKVVESNKTKFLTIKHTTQLIESKILYLLGGKVLNFNLKIKQNLD
jgi:hypothetical protein